MINQLTSSLHNSTSLAFGLINAAHGNLLRKDLGLKDHTTKHKFCSLHTILHITQQHEGQDMAL
jgi:hypothetical protein